MMTFLFIVVFLAGGYIIYRFIFRRANTLKDVNMAVNYRFQDHPGQYSGSLSSTHGTLIFRATRNDHLVSHIVIKDVKIRDRRVAAKLQQVIIMPFRAGEDISAAASLRFRVISRLSDGIDLQDSKVEVGGVIHYDDGVKKSYRTTLSIREIYHDELAIP